MMNLNGTEVEAEFEEQPGKLIVTLKVVDGDSRDDGSVDDD